jgi:Tfp pilus assembly protein PilX
MNAGPSLCRHTACQGGIALLAGLVLLAAVSLLALIAASSMLAQQRMAGHFDDAVAARANAERAVAGGVSLLLATPHEQRSSGCDQHCFQAPTDSMIRDAGELPALPEFEAGAWWRAEGLLPGTDPVTAQSPGGAFGPWAEPPLFLIEEVAFRAAGEIVAPPDAPGIDGVGYYRILGRGTGREAAAGAVYEAIIARPWPGTAATEPPPADPAAFCASFKPWYDCGRMAWRARR